MHGQPGKRAGRNEQLQKADIQEDYTYVIGTADEKRSLYREYGHKDEKDIAYEKVIERQRKHGKELTFAYNQTNPSDYGRKRGAFAADTWFYGG